MIGRFPTVVLVVLLEVFVRSSFRVVREKDGGRMERSSAVKHSPGVHY